MSAFTDKQIQTLIISAFVFLSFLTSLSCTFLLLMLVSSRKRQQEFAKLIPTATAPILTTPITPPILDETKRKTLQLRPLPLRDINESLKEIRSEKKKTFLKKFASPGITEETKPLDVTVAAVELPEDCCHKFFGPRCKIGDIVITPNLQNKHHILEINKFNQVFIDGNPVPLNTSSAYRAKIEILKSQSLV